MRYSKEICCDKSTDIKKLFYGKKSFDICYLGTRGRRISYFFNLAEIGQNINFSQTRPIISKFSWSSTTQNRTSYSPDCPEYHIQISDSELHLFGEGNFLKIVKFIGKWLGDLMVVLSLNYTKVSTGLYTQYHSITARSILRGK